MTYETIEHGRYQIRSGPLGRHWGANAYRGKVPIAKATGATREAAVQELKSVLTKLDFAASQACDGEGAPPADRYEKALVTLLPTLPDSYVAMLRAHLNAPECLISATQLAEAASYPNYGTANLHYGKLGYLVAQEIGFAPPQRPDGTDIWTCALARDPAVDAAATGNDEQWRHPDTGHFRWQLRPQVVLALKALGF